MSSSKKLEHASNLRPSQLGRTRIYRTKGLQKAVILQNDWHGDIALEALHGRRGMSTISFILRHIVTDHSFAALTDFVAECGFNF